MHTGPSLLRKKIGYLAAGEARWRVFAKREARGSVFAKKLERQ
jgi:hypothetical protein